MSGCVRYNEDSGITAEYRYWQSNRTTNRRSTDQATNGKLPGRYTDNTPDQERLQDNANGKLRDKTGNPIEITNGQIRSAEILLNKALPSLQATELQATVQDNGAETMTDAELIAIATGGLKSVR